VDKTQLRAVQLHGSESPGLVENLRKEHLVVIKGLFIRREPFLNTASHYPASAFLVECGAGKLPGGNAETWEYPLAAQFRKSHPLILAGGLTEKNIQEVVRTCLPDAVDLSSGVEIRPGKKDLIKIQMFLDKLSNVTCTQSYRRIF
jgi:phosphoribosylanthranilate isomerase/indole-3-glycerol phosphate synthase/phosphoribosylanthranilate isomerase